MNDIEKEIPKLKGFSIAGGTELSALLDVARTLARRAERRVIAAKEARLCDLSSETMAYMNRLSSLLFALARLANHQARRRRFALLIGGTTALLVGNALLVQSNFVDRTITVNDFIISHASKEFILASRIAAIPREELALD